ncbi:hypothetical protein GPJ56_003479 [Histomonas meleagridis]|uniref:uncharacterized protein n=1 Tax=Histomonas meleagridis TaxID=135588 RepID=UPI003559A321|nr:hypothetical protein GPJ56_003479 [Histomonas meleagridis]KAH0799171.1 hypothetical protein GO595_007968 [Histomonas meleagridis]
MSDDDPLGLVTHVQEVDIKHEKSKTIKIHKTSDKKPIVGLYKIIKGKRKFNQNTLHRLSLDVEKELENEFSQDKPQTISDAFSLTSFSSPSKVSTETNDKDVNGFRSFIEETPSNQKADLTPAICEARAKLFQQIIDRLNTHVNDTKVSMDTCVLQRADEMKNVQAIISQLQSFHYKGIEKIRRNGALMVIYYNKKAKLKELSSKLYRSSMERMVAFIDFLNSIKQNSKTMPKVCIDRFENLVLMTDRKIESNPKIKKITKQIRIIKQHLKKLEPQKPGTGDWYFNLLYPQTKTGNIIMKFREKVPFLTYSDVSSIIDHLIENPNEFSRIEQLMFDIGWQVKPYPFGIGKSVGLPHVEDFFPACIGSNLIDQEFAFTPFSVLNGLEWPFKPAVDKIFEMMILTNPFEIASVYWDAIQEAAQCMQRVLVKSGTRPEDVEIDFDSLFPILMICVFTFGVDEWMQVALYTCSFNEHVANDPQLQFSMTYLEGLITQIMAIDPVQLKKKATELRNQWVEEQSDPLGLH